MKLLLISNSTNAGEEYLRYPLPEIGRFLQGVREVAFVPYAAVTFSYADYERKVQARFSELGIRVRSVHREKDPAAFIRRAKAICVGGGNTFSLARKMQQQGLMQAILRKVKAGTPYVGWSAGSNVCCPTICTTNDMPIVQPESFRAIGAVKFQINPHYLDANPEGHAGETASSAFSSTSRPIRAAGWSACARDACSATWRDGSNCSANVRCGSSRRESRPTRCSRATTSRSYYKVRR